MKRKKILLFMVILLFSLELGVRIGFSISLKTPVWDGRKVILRNYPELKILFSPELKSQPRLPRVLVLGGSAVHTSFCNLDQLLNDEGKQFEVDTLAQYAQNSLDSRYKMQLLADRHYDYVFFYHGINDARTNNCPAEVFDENYRHVSFYNEVYVYFRHPEIRYWMSFWFLDLCIQKLEEFTGIRKTIPKEYNILEYYFEKKAPADPGWVYGNDIKSRKTFRRNLDRILEFCKERNSVPVVMSYASWMPENYSFDKFINKALGYTGHEWPVEIYGEPKYVEAAIHVHNEEAKAAAESHPGTLFVDFASQLPKEGLYFRDICHLRPEGCERMGNALKEALRTYSESHNK